MMTEKRITTAYHEAGHAVMLHLVGYKLGEINIDEEGGCTAPNGLGTLADEIQSKPYPKGYLLWMRARIAGLFGGGVATDIYKGGQLSREDKTWQNVIRKSSYGDYCEAKDDIKELIDWGLPLDEINKSLDEIFDEVVETLKSKWLTVKALAEALLPKGRLSGEE